MKAWLQEWLWSGNLTYIVNIFVPNKADLVHLKKSFKDIILLNVTNIVLFHWSSIGRLIHLACTTCDKDSNMSKVQINLRDSLSRKDITQLKIRLLLSVPIYSIPNSLDTNLRLASKSGRKGFFINSLSAELTFISCVFIWMGLTNDLVLVNLLLKN